MERTRKQTQERVTELLAEASALGISLSEVARLVGVSTNTLRNWREDTTEAPSSKVLALAILVKRRSKAKGKEVPSE